MKEICPLQTNSPGTSSLLMRIGHPQYTSEEGVRSSGGADADAASSSILSRVLLSVDKALSSAASLGIHPQDDPDIEYLSQVWESEKTENCEPKGVISLGRVPAEELNVDNVNAGQEYRVMYNSAS